MGVSASMNKKGWTDPSGRKGKVQPAALPTSRVDYISRMTVKRLLHQGRSSVGMIQCASTLLAGVSDHVITPAFFDAGAVQL